MIEAILAGLARANLAAAAAILLVLLVRKPARRLFGARAAYGLWLIPVLAILAVFAPHPPAPLPSARALAPIAATATQMADVVTAEAPRAMSVLPNLTTALFGLWVVGALAATGLLLHRQARFVASLGRLEPVPDANPRRLRAEHSGVGPAVVGALRPRIVTPSDFESRFAPAERDVVLAHEAVHLANGDARINAVAATVQCLAWFNPLVHLGVRALRIDQELACDATVLGRFPSARRLYAEVLLKTQLATQPLPLGCHWPAGAAHPLKERIVMLKSPLPGRSRKIAGALAVAALSLGGAAAAWATQPAPSTPQPDPTPIALAAIPNNGHLEPEEARKLWRPGLSFLCKPDEKRELHNCRMILTPFETLATAADVQREWPAAAKKAGLTGMVTLQCTPNPVTRRLDQCVGYHFEGAAERPELKPAFEQAAVRVISVIRLKANPGPDEAITRRGFYTIPFDDHPVLPGDPPTNPPTTRFPDYLPGPGGKIGTPAKVSEAAPAPAVRIPASYAPPAVDEGVLWDAKPTVTKPIWTRKPSAEDFARLYPTDAARDGLSADVVVTCRIAINGRLAECGVGPHDIKVAGRQPSPADQDFGTATLQLALIFRTGPLSGDGVTTAGGIVRIPVRWSPPQPAPQQP